MGQELRKPRKRVIVTAIETVKGDGSMITLSPSGVSFNATGIFLLVVLTCIINVTSWVCVMSG